MSAVSVISWMLARSPRPSAINRTAASMSARRVPALRRSRRDGSARVRPAGVPPPDARAGPSRSWMGNPVTAACCDDRVRRRGAAFSCCWDLLTSDESITTGSLAARCAAREVRAVGAGSVARSSSGRAWSGLPVLVRVRGAEPTVAACSPFAAAAGRAVRWPTPVLPSVPASTAPGPGTRWSDRCRLDDGLVGSIATECRTRHLTDVRVAGRAVAPGARHAP